MKKIFSIVASVLFATAMMAQEPVITFEKETHDFGKINEADGRVTTVFNFRNDGFSDKPLVISNVRASCGCTTPQWTKEPIESGGTGAITVTYNPNGRPGKFSKTITISSNAKEPTMRLYIKGEVIPKPAQPVNKYTAKAGELSLVTKQLDFGNIYKTQTMTKTIEYANQTNAPVTVDISELPFVAAEATLSEVQPQKSGQLKIMWDGARCPEYGPVKGILFLTVNGKTANSDEYAIILTADIKEDFSSMTEEQKLKAPIADIAEVIDLGILPAGKAKVTKSIRLTNAGSNPLYVRRIIGSDDMQFPVVKNGIKSEKKGDIKFTINTTKMASTNYQHIITLITNDPIHPVRTVKLTWKVQ